MEHLIKEILLVTCNHTYREYLRSLIPQVKDFHFVFATSINQANSFIKNKRYKLILIDENLLNIFNDESKLFLREISLQCLNLNTILIVEKLTEEIFIKYITYGITYLSDTKTAKTLVLALLKNFDTLENEVYTRLVYKNIVLCTKENAIFLKNCKIYLNSIDVKILTYLIQHSGKGKTLELTKYLSHLYGKPISASYLNVNICRINKTTKAVTGLKIIKNRYGVGYYLNI